MPGTINSKPRIPKRNIVDVTKVDAPSDAAEASPQLAIPQRPFIDRDPTTSPELPADPGASKPTEAPSPLRPQKRTIVPISDQDTAVTQPLATAVVNPAATVTEKAGPKPAQPAPANDAGADIEEPIPEVSAAAKASIQTRKAIQEAEEMAKREQQIEEFIEKKHFFVPINAVARQRSIRVSMGLTFLIFLLGLVLLNLMLDTGLILLIEKIPHTNFFSSL